MANAKPPAGSNPYQSPAAADNSPPPLKFDDKLRIELMRLHAQMLALGLNWIAIGLLAIPIGFAVFAHPTSNLFNEYSDRHRLIGMLYLLLCGAVLVLGLLTCSRQIWAMYAGIVLSYVSAMATLWAMFGGSAGAVQVAALFSLLFLAVVIRRAHRVLVIVRRVNQLRMFG